MVFQALRFLSVGLANTAISIGTIFVAIGVFGFGDLAANAIGYVAGFAFGFILNRNWTFRSNSPSSKDLLRYLTAFLIAYTVNLAVVFSLEHVGIGRFLAQATGVPVYTICFFLLCRWMVFKHA